jgi:AcrR family transcriptional regulator
MSTTNQELMEATYRALVDNGYAGMSIRDITREFEKSQSLIYYHYDNKEELLTKFITFLVEELERELDEIDEENPADRLRAVVSLVLPPTTDVENLVLQQVLGEIRMQTPYHEDYRKQFDSVDCRFRTEFEQTIENGIEDGTFMGVTPQEGADTLLLLLYGIGMRDIPMGDERGIERGKQRIDAVIDRWQSSPAGSEE